MRFLFFARPHVAEGLQKLLLSLNVFICDELGDFFCVNYHGYGTSRSHILQHWICRTVFRCRNIAKLGQEDHDRITRIRVSNILTCGNDSTGSLIPVMRSRSSCPKLEGPIERQRHNKGDASLTRTICSIQKCILQSAFVYHLQSVQSAFSKPQFRIHQTRLELNYDIASKCIVMEITNACAHCNLNKILVKLSKNNIIIWPKEKPRPCNVR